MTQNERQCKYISEALSHCRDNLIPVQMWSDYSTAYLAGKLADRDAYKDACQAPSKMCAYDITLKKWMQEHPEYVFDVMADLNPDKLAALIIQGPEAVGNYIMSQLQESMRDDLDSQDGVSDREAEHDIRQRVQEVREENKMGGC